MKERSLPKLPNGRKKRHPVGIAPRYLGNVSADVTTESLHDPNPSFGEKKKQLLYDHPFRKASKGRVHGKMSRRHSATQTNYHAVIVSSAHGFVQCRIGGTGLPVKRPRGALTRYWTTSANGRAKCGVTANRFAFSQRFGLSSKVVDPADSPIRRLETGSSARLLTELRPAGHDIFRSQPVGGVKGAEGSRHNP
jgi:hypothetical protein